MTDRFLLLQRCLRDNESWGNNAGALKGCAFYKKHYCYSSFGICLFVKKYHGDGWLRANYVLAMPSLGGPAGRRDDPINRLSRIDKMQCVLVYMVLRQGASTYPGGMIVGYITDLEFHMAILVQCRAIFGCKREEKMPTYDYRCDLNGQVLEVRHGMQETLNTWGDLCQRLGMEPGATPVDAKVTKLATGGQVVKSSSLGESAAPCGAGGCGMCALN